MSEQDKRLERLTELAQKTFPDCIGLEIAEDRPNNALPWCSVVWDKTERGDAALLVFECHHSRGLDALEAALLVLAGEPSAADAGLSWASKPTRPGWHWVRAADYADPPWLWEVTARGDDNVLGYLDTYGGWSPCGDDCEWAGPLMLPTESEKEIGAESAEVELQRLRAGIERLAAEWERSMADDGPIDCVMPTDCAEQVRALLEAKP